jgi:hypothetical protein
MSSSLRHQQGIYNAFSIEMTLEKSGIQSKRCCLILKKTGAPLKLQQVTTILHLSQNAEDPNDQLLAADNDDIEVQSVAVESDIKQVNLKLAAVEVELKSLKAETMAVDECILKSYDEWSDTAKAIYGLNRNKNLPVLIKNKDKLQNEKEILRDKKYILIDKKEIIIAKKEMLINKVGIEERKRTELMKRRGEDFVKSIMHPLSLQPITDTLFYMKDVSMLHGKKSNVIMSENISNFWSLCVENTTERKRIFASGSPGIGKTTTMMYLIWLLLNRGKKVVYLRSTPSKDSFYFEWKVNSRGSITTNVYPESMNIRLVIDEFAEDFKDTYYLCDAGKTTHDIMPPEDFFVHVIANGSADDRHWGGSGFKKGRGENIATGLVLTFPMLRKDQIFQARTLFEDFPDELTLEKRHRAFGNIIRFLFEKNAIQRKQIILDQNRDLSSLSADMTKRIMNNLVSLNNNDNDAPRSTIMCMTAEPPDFMKSISEFVSDRVSEQAARTHIRNLWYDISSEDNSTTRDKLFEAYIRTLFCDKMGEFRCRYCCGKTTPAYKNYFNEYLGGCTEIRRSMNIIGDCKICQDGILFYSYNTSEPLVDFLYKFDETYYAIQVTISRQHDCARKDLTAFLRDLDLQKGEKLKLVYAVPDGVFKAFTTKPIKPKVPHGVFILHAEIKPPLEKETQNVQI